MTDATATILLQSIAADRLVVLCGAGLSMAPPSSIPGANAIKAECATKYRREIGVDLDPAVAADLEAMSRWFLQQDRFSDLFITKLVPWKKFNTAPNEGHEAIADFLACGAIHVGVTTNFDRLVEESAARLGEPDFLPLVYENDLPRSSEHHPYLKIHGCSVLHKTRLETVWCREQLSIPSISDRMARFQTWLSTNLFGRDLLIVGFWTDWAYLSEILATTVAATGPNSVVLVDVQPTTDVAAKAPALWAWAHKPGITFRHEQESGAEFLAELRTRFTRVLLKSLLDDAAATHESLFGSPPSAHARVLDTKSMSYLYSLRRDFTGVLRNRPVRVRMLDPSFRIHAAMHSRLMERGASYNAHVYSIGGERIRLINGAGQLLSELKSECRQEPPLPVPVDRVVCIGAVEDPSPASVIRPTSVPGVIHGGVSGIWTTHTPLVRELR
ncbi:MAG: hypothetical protein J5I65_18650 [Aridibacter famidurans]|nr:hypothetical protein [Aridibacter famidurans]